MRTEAHGEEHHETKQTQGGDHVRRGAALGRCGRKRRNTKGRQQPRAAARGEGGLVPGALGGVQPCWKPGARDLRLVASRTVILS